MGMYDDQRRAAAICGRFTGHSEDITTGAASAKVAAALDPGTYRLVALDNDVRFLQGTSAVVAAADSVALPAGVGIASVAWCIVTGDTDNWIAAIQDSAAGRLNVARVDDKP